MPPRPGDLERGCGADPQIPWSPGDWSRVHGLTVSGSLPGPHCQIAARNARCHPTPAPVRSGHQLPRNPLPVRSWPLLTAHVPLPRTPELPIRNAKVVGSTPIVSIPPKSLRDDNLGRPGRPASPPATRGPLAAGGHPRNRQPAGIAHLVVPPRSNSGYGAAHHRGGSPTESAGAILRSSATRRPSQGTSGACTGFPQT
jgi:hypothetical protein